MPSLKHRLFKLEAQVLNVNLSELSDEALRAHIQTLPFKSLEGYRAILALVVRHPSALPVIHDDPERIAPSTSGSSMMDAQHGNA